MGYKNVNGKGSGKKIRPKAAARKRISQARITGQVREWRGMWGWIRPLQKIEHPQAKKNKGDIFVHKNDLQVPGELGVGTRVDFLVYSDEKGLGAECVVLRPDDGHIDEDFVLHSDIAVPDAEPVSPAGRTGKHNHMQAKAPRGGINIRNIAGAQLENQEEEEILEEGQEDNEEEAEDQEAEQEAEQEDEEEQMDREDNEEAGEPEAPPPGWEARWSSEHEAWYYWNKSTKETTWECPKEENDGKDDAADEPLPDGWEKHYDEENEAWFYWHRLTKATSWDPPPTNGKVNSKPSAGKPAADESLFQTTTRQRIQGCIVSWNGSSGTAVPTEEVTEELRPLLEEFDSVVQVFQKDAPAGLTLMPGKIVDFLLRKDSVGLSAADIRTSEESAKEGKSGTTNSRSEPRQQLHVPSKGQKRKAVYDNVEGSSLNGEEHLPDGWKKCWDEEHEAYYFWHKATKTATWEKPTLSTEGDHTESSVQGIDTAQSTSSSQRRKVYESATANVTRSEADAIPPLLPGWVEHWDDEHQAYYYWHKASKQASWERPSITTDDEPQRLTTSTANDSPQDSSQFHNEPAKGKQKGKATVSKRTTNSWPDPTDIVGSRLADLFPDADNEAGHAEEDAEMTAKDPDQQDEEAPLPPGWTQHWNDEHQMYYYWHKATKSASWDRPTDADDGSDSAQQGDTSLRNMEMTDEPSTVADLAPASFAAPLTQPPSFIGIRPSAKQIPARKAAAPVNGPRSSATRSNALQPRPKMLAGANKTFAG